MTEIKDRVVYFKLLCPATGWRHASTREVVGHWRKAGRRGIAPDDGLDLEMPAVVSKEQLSLPEPTRNLRLVPRPEPMLNVSARRWPDGGRWVLQPKWDGWRLLLDVGTAGGVRGWSRHGTDLTARLGSLLAPFTDVAPGTTFDGELVAVSERDGKPAQDFAAVTRAVFAGQSAAADRLRFVAFDLLAVAGEDVRPRPWEDRDARLRETLPVCERVRLAVAQPATLAAHEAIVALGFEGTVLKRLGSTYRPGRHGTWIKRKARFTATAALCSVRQDRDGRWHALCDIDGRRVYALAGARTRELIGKRVELVYSRVDADGGLREARIATP